MYSRPSLTVIIIILKKSSGLYFVLKPDGRNEELSVMMDVSTARSGWGGGWRVSSHGAAPFSPRLSQGV